jgi:hypothetical protein
VIGVGLGLGLGLGITATRQLSPSTNVYLETNSSTSNSSPLSLPPLSTSTTYTLVCATGPGTQPCPVKGSFAFQGEEQNVTLSCPPGLLISYVGFARYDAHSAVGTTPGGSIGAGPWSLGYNGTLFWLGPSPGAPPSGVCGDYVAGGCGFDVSASVSAQCLNKSSCALRPSNTIYGDPCSPYNKFLRVEAICSNRLPASFPPLPGMTGPVSVIGGLTYAASASSVLVEPVVGSSMETPWAAFDKQPGLNTHGFWSSAPATYNCTNGQYLGSSSLGGFSGEWLQLILPSSTALWGYSLQIRSDLTVPESPASWALLGSSDSMSWTPVDTRYNVTWTAPGQRQQFQPTFVDASFSCYAVVFLSTGIVPGPVQLSPRFGLNVYEYSVVAIAEMELYGLS